MNIKEKGYDCKKTKSTIAGLLSLGITFLTVSSQSWKAAASNPVEVLKNE
jgi:hypothetical protein